MKHELLKAITAILAPDYIKMAPRAMEAAKKIYNAVDFKELECSSEHIETLIPKLVWQSSEEEMVAKTPFGNYSIYKDRNNNWMWSYYTSISEEETHHCGSLIDGVVLSNEDWHTKVLSIFKRD